MKPVAVAFTVYPVADLARARRFYETVLGLTPTNVSGDDAYGSVEYDLGPHTVALGCGGPFQPGATGGKVALEVADFSAAVEELQRHQVSFVITPTETPACHMAAVTDPDGNVIIIHCRKRDLAGPAVVHQ